MAAKSTANDGNADSGDVVSQMLATLQTRDTDRVNYLQQCVQLLAAQTTAMQTEQKRLTQKYGAGSTQADDAAARLNILTQESAALTADITRASTPTPALTADAFVIYGYILDADGDGLSGAKVTANRDDGTALANAKADSKGFYVLKIPLSGKAAAASVKTVDESSTPKPIALQLIVTRKNTPPYTYPELLVGVGGRMAYREITAAGSSELPQ